MTRLFGVLLVLSTGSSSLHSARGARECALPANPGLAGGLHRKAESLRSLVALNRGAELSTGRLKGGEGLLDRLDRTFTNYAFGCFSPVESDTDEETSSNNSLRGKAYGIMAALRLGKALNASPKVAASSSTVAGAAAPQSGQEKEPSRFTNYVYSFFLFRSKETTETSDKSEGDAKVSAEVEVEEKLGLLSRLDASLTNYVYSCFGSTAASSDVKEGQDLQIAGEAAPCDEAPPSKEGEEPTPVVAHQSSGASPLAQSQSQSPLPEHLIALKKQLEQQNAALLGQEGKEKHVQ